MTIIDDVGVPLRGMFVLMVLFAVVVGPVSMIVLGRKNRRIWLLWTVPTLSVLCSLAVVGTLLFSHGGRPLPFIEWTTAFLFVAISFDLRDRRIPNALNFPALLIAFALAFHTGGGFLLRDSLLGAGLMFAILFPAFAFRALGAGDVKALMVLGALWGPDMATASPDGQLGWTSGRYENWRQGPDGIVTSEGRYLTLWARQADGTWKVDLDTGVPDPGE